MANPIPTQLSPGVNVSEIDLSQFIVPEGLNVGGMVGIFNWGPGLVATNISTESNLATIFGKPTSDASAVDGNQDFNAAANFLRYSSPLKVIRAIKAGEVNATSDDAGVTWIGSVDQRTLGRRRDRDEGILQGKVSWHIRKLAQSRPLRRRNIRQRFHPRIQRFHPTWWLCRSHHGSI